MNEEVASRPSPVASDACSCAEFSRASLIRAGAAQAGRGLPAIEPGMPVPAGTGLSRRSFLLRSAGLAMAVYGAAAGSPRSFEQGIAEASAAGPSDAILVSVFLAGGVDAMSVLAPTGDSRYATLRPTLALAPDDTRRFGEDDRLQWHPSADGMKTLHEEGKVTVFPAIGYTGPNQSHFTSRHFWEVGDLNPSGRVGWLGRYLDRHGSAENPLQGLALNPNLAPALATAANPVAAVSRPDQYRFSAHGVGNPVEAPMLAEIGRQGGLSTADPTLLKARAVARSTSALREQVSAFSTYTSPVTYPTGNEFPRRLSALAAMLAGGLPLRVVAIQGPGGYDTHADQATSLASNLKILSDSLLAFQRDLEARGLADRVLVQVWSEFGRRPQQNGSGTDHGAAGGSFLIGSRASGQMIGEFPGLGTGTGGGLDNEQNLRNTSDFRGVYRSLLDQWLGVDPDPIVPAVSGLGEYALIR